jgi:hypothetical protein
VDRHGRCAKTADAIVRRCPKVHSLATSRELLGIGGETIYRVPSLSLPEPGEAGPAAAGSCDAVALFAERARQQGAGLTVDEQTPRSWRRSAGGWTGCRWPSSWPPKLSEGQIPALVLGGRAFQSYVSPPS